MNKKDPLGQFEQLVLTAVLLLGDKGYGIAVARKVEELADRPIALGAVYMTLARMEDKGFISSWRTNPTPDCGGREKRYYRLRALGERVLVDAAVTAKRIYEAVAKMKT